LAAKVVCGNDNNIKKRISLEELVSPNHIYRKFQELCDFTDIKKELEKIEIESYHKGFGIFRLFLDLLLQFTEDLSDRSWKDIYQILIQLNGSAISD
jgi:hypothetical protein